jgi:CTP:molybdopterin cytidylyltransferase MocA
MELDNVGRLGCVLAAGAGTRWGYPKILEPQWLATAVAALDPHCSEVLVVTGAARPPMPAPVTEIHCPQWSEGLAASFRAAIDAASTRPDASALVLLPVDTPGVDERAVGRAVSEIGVAGAGRATYGGVPGHPVVLPRHLWSRASELAHGDSGARELLRRLAVAGELHLVECGDYCDGEDHDERPQR